MRFRHRPRKLPPESPKLHTLFLRRRGATRTSNINTLLQLIPAPRGTSLVASPAVKRLLQLAGIEDAYTSSAGSTKTLENTLKATFAAISNSYGFLTPNLWKETKLIRSPLEEFADTLQNKRY